MEEERRGKKDPVVNYKQLLMTKVIPVLTSSQGKNVSASLTALHVGLHAVGGGAGDDLHREPGVGAFLWTGYCMPSLARHCDGFHRGRG